MTGAGGHNSLTALDIALLATGAAFLAVYVFFWLSDHSRLRVWWSTPATKDDVIIAWAVVVVFTIVAALVCP